LKEIVTRIKRKLIVWEKIFAGYSTDKGLMPRIQKSQKKLNNKRTNNPINKWQMN
jgi:hypothetical protein